jgi:hypothetical protein
MAKASNKGDLAVVDQKANLPANYDYDDVGGFEGLTSSDFAIPFLAILQANSKAVEQIDAAKAGMLMNTVTQELFAGNTGFAFVPATTKHCYVEWRPRDAGGGFVGQYDLNDAVVKEATAKAQAKAAESGKKEDAFKLKTAAGNDLIETYYVFGVLKKDSGEIEQAVIAFSSTKIKIFKQWMYKAQAIQVVNSQGRRITPPLFAHVYRVSTTKQKNNKGEFYNFAIAFDGAKDAAGARLGKSDELFQIASHLREQINLGEAKVAYESQDAAGGEVIDGEASEVADKTTGKAPF